MFVTVTQSSGGFEDVLRSEDAEVLVTRVQTPNASAVAERWIGTVRRECWTGCSRWVLGTSSRCSGSTSSTTTLIGHIERSS